MDKRLFPSQKKNLTEEEAIPMSVAIRQESDILN